MAFNFNEDFPQEWKEENMTSKAFLGVTTDDDDEGAKITDVTSESAAKKAGLQKGDIITKIDDKQISASTLSEIIGDYKPKDNIKVYYKRDGKEKNAKVTLGETKRGAMSFAFRTPEGKLHSFSLPKIPGPPPTPPMPGEIWDGSEFRDLTRGGLDKLESINIFSHRQKLGLKIQDTEEGNGIKVLSTEKDSPAEKAGMQKDDIVTEIGGKKINNTDDAREQLHEMHDKSSYSIKAKRNGSEMTFDIKIPKKLKTANL
ncbi:MAG: PDZ domain-containing protein [Chitinophagaceae bacterium]|nr:PDZ domain-containing protein [Chitinophagaceae bacterium]